MYTRGKFLFIVILATIFGLGSGVVGTLLTRVYILEESFDLPFFGEINLSGANYNGHSIIISNPKKVVVEQNAKVEETVKAAEGSIVGIFKKNGGQDKSLKEAEKFNINDYYQVSQEIGQGVIITSDGWIMSSFIPADIKDILSKEKEPTETAWQEILANYVIITNGKKVYSVQAVVLDDLSSLSFWQVSTNDFPVKKFTLREEINRGQLLIGVNWDKQINIATIYNIANSESSLVRSSDDFSEELVLSSGFPEGEKGFFFDLNGNLAALVGSKNEIIPIYSYLSCINCLLRGEAISRAKLGLNYVDLSEMVSSSDKEEVLIGALVSKNTRGVAVEKDSPADKAGVKEGDIILSVNNISLSKDNSLSQVITGYKFGEEVSLIIDRQGERTSVSVKLGE